MLLLAFAPGDNLFFVSLQLGEWFSVAVWQIWGGGKFGIIKQ